MINKRGFNMFSDRPKNFTTQATETAMNFVGNLTVNAQLSLIFLRSKAAELAKSSESKTEKPSEEKATHTPSIDLEEGLDGTHTGTELTVKIDCETHRIATSIPLTATPASMPQQDVAIDILDESLVQDPSFRV